MFDKQEIPVVKYGYNRNCLLYSHTKTTEKKFKPTKGKPAGVFGGLGRGGYRKKGCLSCVSEKQPFFREVVEQAPERNCENTEKVIHKIVLLKGLRTERNGRSVLGGLWKGNKVEKE